VQRRNCHCSVDVGAGVHEKKGVVLLWLLWSSPLCGCVILAYVRVEGEFGARTTAEVGNSHQTQWVSTMSLGLLIVVSTFVVPVVVSSVGLSFVELLLRSPG
jgi:hypothetical protein